MSRRFAKQGPENNQTNANPTSINFTLEDAQQAHELANCRIIYAILFSLLSPIVGYSYTGRFTALGVFLGSGLIILLSITQTEQGLDLESKKVKMGLGIGIATVAAVDNSRAIWAARQSGRKT